MKNLVRLTIFVIILAGLAVGTTFALASGAKTLLNIDLRSTGAMKSSDDSSADYVAVSVSKSAELHSNGSQEAKGASSAASNAESKAASSTSSYEDDMEIVGMVESLTSDSIVISGTVIAITAETEIKDPIAVGDMVKAHTFTADDGTLTAREIELLDDEDDDPGDDDDEDTTVITGTVESLTSDAIVVSGIVIAITSETEIDDEIAVGDTVKVHAFTADDGTLTAHEIELFEDDDDMEDPGDDDDSDDDSDGDDSSGDDQSDDDSGEDDSDGDDSGDDDSGDDDSGDDD